MATRHVIHSRLVCLAFLLSALDLTAAAPTSSTNITSLTNSIFQRDKPDDITCVYRISGTYGAPLRVLYYTGLFTTMFLRQNDWLVGGMFASAIIYSSTAVVHAWVIVFNSGVEPEVIDLDIVAIQVMLLSGALLSFPVMQSTTLKRHGARSVVVVWSSWLLVGVFLSLFSWSRAHGREGTIKSEPACRAGNNTFGTTLRSPAQLAIEDFNCTYTCFSSRNSKIRAEGEIFAAPSSEIDAWPRTVLLALSITVLSLAWVFVRYSDYGDLPGPQRRETFSGFVLNYFQICGKLFVLYVLCILGALAVIISGEFFLFSNDNIFKTEEYYAVGQWSAVVSVALVLAFAFIDRTVIQPFRRLQIIDFLMASLHYPNIWSKAGLVAIILYSIFLHKPQVYLKLFILNFGSGVLWLVYWILQRALNYIMPTIQRLDRYLYKRLPDKLRINLSNGPDSGPSNIWHSHHSWTDTFGAIQNELRARDRSAANILDLLRSLINNGFPEPIFVFNARFYEQIKAVWAGWWASRHPPVQAAALPLVNSPPSTITSSALSRTADNSISTSR